QQRLTIDLQAARAALAAAPVGVLLAEQLSHELDAIAEGIVTLAAPDPAAFAAIVPLNDLHARIFAVQAAIARANGFPELGAWPANPWDFLRPLDKPPAAATRDTVSIVAMNGETRAGAINVSSAASGSMAVTLNVAGAAPGRVGLHEHHERARPDTGQHARARRAAARARRGLTLGDQRRDASGTLRHRWPAERSAFDHRIRQLDCELAGRILVLHLRERSKHVRQRQQPRRPTVRDGARRVDDVLGAARSHDRRHAVATGAAARRRAALARAGRSHRHMGPRDQSRRAGGQDLGGSDLS